ncbi:MAG: hypothetical protein ACI4JX_04880, partial [Oscillospiraceae bacterium]
MMCGKTFGKAVAAVGMLAALTGLFGCNNAPKPARHELSEISAVSIYCSHMDFSYCYSFRIHREQEKWLFDAKCFTHGHEKETVLENCEVGDDDMNALFEILEHNNSIAYAENYKKPMKSPFTVMDETVYGFCLTFSDGNQFVTYNVQKELEEFFY